MAVILKCWTMASTSVLTSSGIPRVVERFMLSLLLEALFLVSWLCGCFGHCISTIFPRRNTMVCSSGAESARYTFFFWLIVFISLTVLSEKSDRCPQSHSKDEGKISLGIGDSIIRPSALHARVDVCSCVHNGEAGITIAIEMSFISTQEILHIILVAVLRNQKRGGNRGVPIVLHEFAH